MKKSRLLIIFVIVLIILCSCNVAKKTSSTVVFNTTEDYRTNSSSEAVTSLSTGTSEKTKTIDGITTTSSTVTSTMKSTGKTTTTTKTLTKATTTKPPQPPMPKELRAMWISFFELNFAVKTEANFKAQINTMFDTVKNDGFNAVFVHVRAFSDAYYKSSYFPWSKSLTGIQGKNPNYDPLLFMVDAAHKRGLQFYAWINPFRVSSSSTDYKQLATNNPARIYATDTNKSNDDWSVACSGGIYYNPAIPEIQKLIIDGVREIVRNYLVDGIYFDDYFYPTTDASFDKIAYNKYLATKPKTPLSLGDWRRTQINTFVSGTYRAVKAIKSNVQFGISPQANCDTNYNMLFADVNHWLDNDGYVDSIMPQLYFGFEYPIQSFKFTQLLTTWSKMRTNKNVTLYIALGIYKSGLLDAKDKSSEWKEHTDIIKRQVALCRTNSNVSGFSIFSYSTYISKNTTNALERKNLLTILK